MEYKYYYNNHHLYQAYCKFDNKIFNTRIDYLNYCKENNIPLRECKIKKVNKFSLEWEAIPPCTWVNTTVAKRTEVFDQRDLSNFYFEDEADAFKFLEEYGEGDSSFALEALFSGVKDEPNYSADAIADEILKDIIVEPFDPFKENKKFAHYIISYLPDDWDDKQARKVAHLKQLKSIKATTPNAKIYIIAQNYKEEDYIVDPQIIYYKYGKLGAMKARNTALNHFYNSNYDFCILNDDDTVINPTETAKNFFLELENNTEKFTDFDIIWSRDMIHHPFQPSELPELNNYNNNWVFNYCLTAVWHYAVVRNFKKFYNKEEYQDESVDPTKGNGYDDADFCYYLHSQGYKIWKTLNALQSYALNWTLLKHSVVYKNTQNPWIRLNNKKNNINRWLLDEEGKPNIGAFMQKCGRTKTNLTIAREVNGDTLKDFYHRNAIEFINNYKLNKEEN